MRSKRIKKTAGRSKKISGLPSIEVIEPESSGRLAEYVAVGLLVAVGLIYSLHFLRHFVFPNSDFVAFLRIGRQWLHLQIPGSMKRAPLFSMITASVGFFLPGPDRYLFGTELYNAVMLPTAMVLIYAVGRDFLGKAAVWVALLAGISPWMVRMSSQPLAELTLVVIFAATALCARSHINWAYLFAMLGSIARWDMAGLILAVAVVDIIRNRKWARTIILTSLAAIPFGLCMIITVIQLRGEPKGAHYLQVLAKDSTFELFADLRFYWRNICSFLNAQMVRTLPSGQIKSFGALNSAVFWGTGMLLTISFLAGSVIGVVKKRWEIIVMLLVGIPYLTVHAAYPYRMSRFCVPLAWAGLVIAAYGAITFWQWFETRMKPKFLVSVLQSAGAAVFILWAIKIADTLTYAGRQCPVIGRLVVMSSLLVVAGFFALQLVRRCKPSMGWLIAPAFLVLAVVSNATEMGFLMGDGQRGANFKCLGRWFLENAGSDDRMLTTMAGFMPVYTGLPRDRFEHTGNIKPADAKDFSAFIRECRKRGITLIAWDSRLAGRRDDRYYKLWGLDRIEILGALFSGRRVKRIGSCELVHIISEGSPKMVIWRIMPAQTK